MDPDTALQNLGAFPVLKSFMIFIDQQENSVYLKNACRKLDQFETRYAYIMFALLNGMTEVEGEMKSNRLLEYALEEITCAKYYNEEVKSKLIPLEHNTFCATAFIPGQKKLCIKPNFETWVDPDEARNILSEKASDDDLEKLFNELHDKSIPEEFVKSYVHPITITIDDGLSKPEVIIVHNALEAKKKGVNKLLSAKKEKLNPSMFKKYLGDKKVFEKLYKKNSTLIQKYCKTGVDNDKV
jgi:hypothetical protein